MSKAHAKHGWHQKGLRRSVPGWQPDSWWLNLAGAVRHEWRAPSWGEIAAYASRIGIKDLGTFCKAQRLEA